MSKIKPNLNELLDVSLFENTDIRIVSDNTKLDYLYNLIADNKIKINQLPKELLNYVNERGFSLILFASIEGRLDVIEQLIENKNVIYESCYQQLNSTSDPLHLAVKFNHFDLIKYLIEKKNVSLDNYDSYKKTPLYYSIEQGHNKIFEYLISKGSKIDLINENIFKLAINSLEISIIDSIMPYLNTEQLNICPFSILINSKYNVFDEKKKLKMFEYLLRHPKIFYSKNQDNIKSINNVFNLGKFKYLKLLILYGYDLNDLDIEKLRVNNLENYLYEQNFLNVLKVFYFLDYKYDEKTQLNIKNIKKIEIVNNFNNANEFFGNFDHVRQNNIISLENTEIFETFSNWYKKKKSIFSLKQLARNSLRRKFNKNLFYVLEYLNYPVNLIKFCQLEDLNCYMSNIN